MDKIDRVRILNVDIMSISIEEALKNLKKGLVLTPNIRGLYLLQHDKRMYQIYQTADWIFCDSTNVFFFSHIIKRPIKEVIRGANFFTEFYMYHKDDENCKIFLLGAKDGVANIAKEKINEKVGREIVVGAYSPIWGFEKYPQEIEKMIDVVNKSGANVVVVGLGDPKQAYFIDDYRHRMPLVDIWMALGATIDFEAGQIRRCPRFIQKIGCEWIYRMCREPKRFLPRFKKNITVVADLLRQLLGKYRNPFG